MRLVLLLCMVLAMTCGVTHGQEDETAADGYEDATYQDSPGDESDHTLVDPVELQSTRDYQASPMSVSRFDAEKWKAIVGDVNYKEKEPEKKKKKKEEKTEESSAGSPALPWGGPLLRAMVYLVITAVIVALVYLVVRNISFDLKIRRTEITDADLTNPVEDIQAIDVRTALERAINEGNFKLAVRLYYLDLLKKLNETGVIVWKKDKTNRDYLGELFARDYFFDDIRNLTFSYERVWYGDHELRSQSFDDLSIRFQAVHAKIHSVEKRA
ncbi:MAG: hypothetical protein M3Y60_11590 [Bacteroidota bacterium]|nr:hypothetical protein [Bacteroidota bacterium]